MKSKENKLLKKRQCILILGMHRSGTSVLTRLQNIRGAGLPRNIIQSNDFNQSGYWEPARILEYNDRVLAQLNSSWGDWMKLDWSMISAAKQSKAKEEISRIIESEYGDEELIVIKDPRISRFSEIYIDILEGMGFEVLPVLTFRNPLEVIASLKNRDGFASSHSALLWLRHTLDSEVITREMPRVIVSYELLRSDWETADKLITQKLSPNYTFSAQEVSDLVESFINKKLINQKSSIEDLVLDPLGKGWVSSVYQAMTILQKNDQSERAFAVLDEVRRQFDGSTGIIHQISLNYSKNYEEKEKLLEDKISHFESKDADVQQTLADKESQIEALNQALQYNDQRNAQKISDLAKQINGLNEEILALEGKIKSQNEAENELNNKLETLKVDFKSHEKSSAERDSVINDLQKDIAEKSQALAEVEKLLSQTQEALEGLKLNNSSIEADKKELEFVVDRIKHLLRLPEGHNESLSASIRDIIQTKEAVEKSNGMLEANIHQLKGEISEVRNQKESLQQEFKTTEDVFYSKNKELLKVISDLENSKRTLNDEINQLQNDFVEIKVGNDALKQDLKISHETFQAAKTDFSNALNRIEDAKNQEIKDLQNFYENSLSWKLLSIFRRKKKVTKSD